MTGMYAEPWKTLHEYRPWAGLTPLHQTLVKYQFPTGDHAAWWWRFDHGQAECAYAPGTLLPVVPSTA